MNKPCVIDIFYGDNEEDGKHIGADGKPVYPHPIDWTALKGAGIVGCVHKATEGTGFIDPLYAIRRSQARIAGIRWGAYHFLHDGDGEAQADHFLAVALPEATTLVACDWENIGKGAPSVATVKAFCQRIYDKLGRWPVLYSGNVAKELISGVDAFFAKLKLWLCEYGPAWKVQASWARPWLWQQNGDTYGPGPHTLPGIRGLVDNNCIIDPMTVDDLMTEWAA